MKIILLLLISLFSISCNNDKKVVSASTASVSTAISKTEIIVYKNPNCGCCTKWVEHMRDNGFKLTEKPVPNLSEIKDQYGVPKDKRSCHTAIMGDYVFEGHIPAKSIKRFLKEKSSAKGLVVPDMPIGSPGMEYGDRKDKYSVYSFSTDGTSTVFETVN